jgi:excisionase family DNA binding protein
VLNAKEAAKYIGVSKSYLDKLRIYGGSPAFFKIGARVVYDPADLDTWLASKKVANTSQAQQAVAA